MTEYAPEIGPDGRPRPRFGEYATPEEQRARIRQPDATAALSAGQAPPDGPTAASPVRPSALPSGPAAASRGRAVDRIVTGLLLAYGLVTVLTSIPTAVDYARFADAFLSTLGVDASLSDPQAGRWWGLAAALVLGIGWLVAAVLAWRGLRAGRVTFWIPLVAGIVCNLISSTLLIAPLMIDPAVWSALQSAIIGTTG